MVRNRLHSFALAAICAVAGLAGYALLKPHAAQAGCGGGNCLEAPCETRPCVVDIVTAEEAALPAALGKTHLPGRSIFPGPDIVQVQPSPGGTVHPPFALRIDFRLHSHEPPVDVSSVKIFYEKNPEIDLTDRLHAYISRNGISIPSGALPAGSQSFAVHVADTDYHTNTAIFTITVAPH